jgi:hypothetical protein
MTSINERNHLKRDSYIKKLVSNARAIISNQIALPLGASKMTGIISWVDQIEPINQIDLAVFSEYRTKTKDLPLGTERLSYNLTYLKQQDEQLDELTKHYKDKIIEKCFEIIAVFGNRKSE